MTTLPGARRHAAGAGSIGVVVALSLLTLAALLYLQRTGDFDGPVALTTTAVAITLLGLAIIVAGLRGRTTGALSALAILGLLVALPLTALSNADWDGRWGTGVSVGDVSYTPTDVATAERGFSLGLGEATIDLTELPPSDVVVDVPIRLGAGDLTVIVPRDSAVTARISLGAGEVNWFGDVTTGAPGASDLMLESDAVNDGESTDIALDMNVGAGTVRVLEEGR
ncbi:MAG TPA: LiaF domain-containing protein [Actinotalea sp.]|nr:LiaF domain-containing protein [Actinotalea sp.]